MPGHRFSDDTIMADDRLLINLRRNELSRRARQPNGERGSFDSTTAIFEVPRRRLAPSRKSPTARRQHGRPVRDKLKPDPPESSIPSKPHSILRPLYPSWLFCL
jgi:hypothetical protein